MDYEIEKLWRVADIGEDNFEHEQEIKDYLEKRSGRRYDLESIRYMIEEFRMHYTRKNQGIYEFIVKNGMVTRLA